MRGYLKSLGHALEGLAHAFVTERNFRLFTILYVISLLLGIFFGISIRDWEIVIFTGGIFLGFELLNTALEHFTDAFDSHSKSIHTSAIKATKDIAAAASLVCAIAWGIILIMIYLPYLVMLWVIW